MDNKHTITLTKRDRGNFLIGGEQVEIDVVGLYKKILKIVGTPNVNFSSLTAESLPNTMRILIWNCRDLENVISWS